MVMLTAPMYLVSTNDKEITNLFLLDQQILGSEPKLRVYLEVDLQYVLSQTQFEFVKPMKSNVKLVS